MIGAVLTVLALGLPGGAVHLSTVVRTAQKLTQHQRRQLRCPAKRARASSVSRGVTNPTITVYHPAACKNTGHTSATQFLTGTVEFTNQSIACPNSFGKAHDLPVRLIPWGMDE